LEFGKIASWILIIDVIFQIHLIKTTNTSGSMKTFG